MHKISGAGHVLNQFVAEDVATNRPPTELTATWLNDVQNELASAAQKDGEALGVSDHQLADVLGARIRHFATGVALPNTNIGTIWHDDYNSLMTWQVFNLNGAAYNGYASVLVGNLLLDTQPTPRVGYISSGVANLSRTAYAALRGWAMHNGIMVAEATWAAGAIAVKDNVDGTTFTAFDVRGEFPRYWDNGRGVDTARVFGSHQAAYAGSLSIASQSQNVTGGSTPTLDYIIIQGTNFNDGLVSSIIDVTPGDNRPINVALLSCIKY